MRMRQQDAVTLRPMASVAAVEAFFAKLAEQCDAAKMIKYVVLPWLASAKHVCAPGQGVWLDLKAGFFSILQVGEEGDPRETAQLHYRCDAFSVEYHFVENCNRGIWQLNLSFLKQIEDGVTTFQGLLDFGHNCPGQTGLMAKWIVENWALRPDKVAV